MPVIEVAVPAERWVLSDEGRRRCSPLDDRLAPYRPEVIVCSEEPKATETASIVGERLGVPVNSHPSLHEHVRTNVGYLSDTTFRAAVERSIHRPDEVVLGSETANQAAHRFASAIDQILEQHPTGSLAVVAHGTVISLFVAAHNPIDAFAVWQRLDLPSLVVLDRASLALLTVVAKMESGS